MPEMVTVNVIGSLVCASALLKEELMVKFPTTSVSVERAFGRALTFTGISLDVKVMSLFL